MMNGAEDKYEAKQFLTVKEAAERLGISELTVRRKVQKGLLPTLFPPGETPIRIDLVAINQMRREV